MTRDEAVNRANVLVGWLMMQSANPARPAKQREQARLDAEALNVLIEAAFRRVE